MGSGERAWGGGREHGEGGISKYHFRHGIWEVLHAQLTKTDGLDLCSGLLCTGHSLP